MHQSQTAKFKTVIIATTLGTSAALFVGCGTPASHKMEPTVIQSENGSITTLIPTGTKIDPSKIIGENDLLPVDTEGKNVPAKYSALLNAFGRVDMGCTATHIGNGLALTAGHCFQAASFRQNHLDCSEHTIEWGLRANGRPSLVSRCEMILAQETNIDRDYAIIRVNPAPSEKIEIDFSPVSEGTPITLFGHPKLRPLEWSGECEILDRSHGDWGVDAFAHQCDTEAGNSGSTVLNTETLKVVGIHDGGIAPYNYGTLITETPIFEFTSLFMEGPDLGGEDTSETPTEMTFQDLNHNESRVLVEFQEGDYVSFDLEVKTEVGYDYVIVTDGLGKETPALSGEETYEFEQLKTPIRVSFFSDYGTKSESISLTNISVY